MNIINVENLCKEFRIQQKQQGIKGNFQALFHPNYSIIEAVRDINFTVNAGEMIGFIGPNGAGKSTVIKMLTGILYPTKGNAKILGLNPWRERRKLAYHIGTVFGQKSQLWYHLPPRDSFKLLSTIYELDRKAYQEQIAMLIDVFELSEMLNIPVRKLSLGQRMKCEIAASLIHRPQLIFLDEPTIGLDVVSRQQIRETLKKLNKLMGATVFITSHDAGDVESLCKRIMVVNHGTIVFDDQLATLKGNFLVNRNIKIHFEDPIEDDYTIENVEVSKTGPFSVEIRVDTGKISISDLTRKIIEQKRVVDIVINELPMEDIIRKIYASMFDTYLGRNTDGPFKA